jgi:hypothetical protein
MSNHDKRCGTGQPFLNTKKVAMVGASQLGQVGSYHSLKTDLYLSTTRNT